MVHGLFPRLELGFRNCSEIEKLVPASTRLDSTAFMQAQSRQGETRMEAQTTPKRFRHEKRT